MKRSAGFTLLEVLIAVTLTALVLGAVYGLFTGVTRARSRAEEGSATSHLARVIFDRVGREVRGAWRPASGTPFFVAGADREGRPELRFATASATLEATGRGGIAALRYHLEPTPEATDGTLTLFRGEEPLHLRDRLDHAGYPLCRGVRSLTWRFYGRDGWVDRWEGTAAAGLPQLVELSVTLASGRDEVAFRGVFDLPESGVGL